MPDLVTTIEVLDKDNATKSTRMDLNGSKSRVDPSLQVNGQNVNGTQPDSPVEENIENESTSEEQRCEVKLFKGKYDLNHERQLKAQDSRSRKLDADTEKEKKKYALCSYKWYHPNGELESASLEVSSAHIIKALRQIINEYPGEQFWGNSITIKSPYKPVFHYRSKLDDYMKSLNNGDEKAHINLFLDFYDEENRRKAVEYQSGVLDAGEKASVSWDNLWMVYKPGELVFTGSGSSLRCMEVVDTYSTGGSCPQFIVIGRTFTHDGKRFGYQNNKSAEEPFEGVKRLTELSCVPYQYFDGAVAAEERLSARGAKFCALEGPHHREYSGSVSALTSQRNWERSDRFIEESITITSSRIMVDAKMFSTMKSPNRVRLVKDETKLPKDRALRDGEGSITYRNMLLADYKVPGYAFQSKRWCWFNVDDIQPIVFAKEAFRSLLIPPKEKKVLRSLVRAHVSGGSKFDDLIPGKGQGLIFVLHGCPGVGKTYTAESLADEIEQPLYVLNSGELGIDVYEVQKNLTNAIMLAVAWKAVLLIDEADVFLEKRSTNNLQRNCFVSLFLRTLEYYEGILFLTTNRITTFDDAIKSRIHLALKYDPLTVSFKKELFANFIARASDPPPTIDDVTLTRLAAADINGRQIKNAVRTASALAWDDDVPLSGHHLEYVLQTIEKFETDLADEEQSATRE